ncbi:MAG: Calx-beta domain-containing protein, partial [Lentimicrobiaceae bacterium]
MKTLSLPFPDGTGQEISNCYRKETSTSFSDLKVVSSYNNIGATILPQKYTPNIIEGEHRIKMFLNKKLYIIEKINNGISETRKKSISALIVFLFLVVGPFRVNAQTVVKQLYLSDPSQALDRVDPVATADGTTAHTPSILMAAGCSAFTSHDDFSTASYNNFPTQWLDAWSESSDDGSPTGGTIQIVSGELRFQQTGTLDYIQRSANLTGANCATLTFSWRAVGLEENIEVWVSNAANGTFTRLAVYTGQAVSGNASFDISAYISSATTIRFMNSDATWSAADDQAFFDNISIVYGSTGNNSATFIQSPTLCSPLTIKAGTINTNVFLSDITSGPGTITAVATTSKSATSVANGGTLSFSHTPGTGSNRLLLVAISVGNTGVSDETAPGTITGVTFGGTAMTLVNTAYSGNATRSYIYQMVNPTASPSANVVITIGTKASGVIASATTFTGVNQTTPLGTANGYVANGSDAFITGALSSASGELVYSTAAIDEYVGVQQGISVPAGQTELWKNSGFDWVSGASSTKEGASSVTLQYNMLDYEDGCMSAVSIKPAPALGTLPANPNITAVIKYGSTDIITLSNPMYNSGTGLLTWTCNLATDVTIPSGQAIALVVTTNQWGVSFTIDYDSQTKPSKIEFTTSTFIDITNYDIYNAAYPGGSIISTATAIPIGTIVYPRVVVADPFGNSDITALNITLTPPGNIVAGTSVATTTCTRTFQYVWNTTGATAGTVALPATAKEGYENTATDVQALNAELCTPIGTPVFDLGATSTRCQEKKDIVYKATSENATGITYNLDAASIAAGNSINSSTGKVSYVDSWIGTSVITATAAGCGGPKTATHTVTTNGIVTNPVFTLGVTSTRCQAAVSTTYSATSDYTSGITYTLDAASLAGGNTINASTGAVTYATGWFGTSVITANAAGCGGPLTSTHTVTTTGTITPPIFTLGATSTRCQGAGGVTYSASSANTTGITYSLDAASITGGNTINSSTGLVTYVAGWSGTSIITALAAGCGGPKSSAHTVTITLSVELPYFTLGATSKRCQEAAGVTYAASATNSTAITYSLDAASTSAGNTINTSSGLVTFTAGWSGTSIITATATGCNGPTTGTHSVLTVAVDAVDDAFTGYQGSPNIFNVLTNDLCNINPASLVIVSQPQSGTLQMGTNGEITYLPNGNFTGNDAFTYQISNNNAPIVSDQATVYLTVESTFGDPCAEAVRSKTFYLPFPENSTQLRDALWNAASVSYLTNNVRTIISIKTPYPGTNIIYDQWEDGYEANITVPVQATTKIWGDGNLSNGVAPGYPTDIIPAGGYILLDNQFAYNPRVQSEIVYDGKDKIFSTSDIAISKIEGDAGSNGGSILFDVQNIKSNVVDVSRFGKLFVIPFGEDVTLGGTGAFKYTSLFIRAATDGTVVKLDYNGDKIVDATKTLNEGEVWLYDGTASTPGVAADVNQANDIKAGATVTSNYPIGVDLLFGGIDNYGTRNIAILPGAYYGNSYYCPVHTTLASAPVYVFFTNTLTTPIIINWTAGTGATGSVTIPPNGKNYLDLSLNAGYKFESQGGEAFTAVAVVDADASGSSYDWAFNLIPSERLTTFTSVAWAPGSNDLSGNYNPVWVTPTANTTLYIKYDGNLTTPTATMSPCKIPYDIAVPLSALQSYLIFDPDNDQSGLAIYTCDGTTFAAVWGQDANAGNPTPTSSPAMDVGYVLEPKCLQQLVLANDDFKVTKPSTPIIIGVAANDFGFLCSINPASVNTTGMLQPANGTAEVHPDGTITYTPNSGFLGTDKFEYRICSVEYPDICDVAMVTIAVTYCNASPTENLINGNVFIEMLPDDGTFNPGEAYTAGVKVDLYLDPNCNGVIDAGEGITQSTVSDLSGNYSFTTKNGFDAKDDFDPTASYSGNDGGVNFSSNWLEQSDDGVLGTGDVQIIPDISSGGMGNAIRIDGPNNGISRSLTFSGATAAFLRFSYRRLNFNNGGEQLLVQLNGTTIYSINDGDYVGTDVNYTDVDITLSTYNANGVNTIQFITNGVPATNEYFWIDNVELVYIKDPACFITKVNPSNTNGAYTASLLNQQTAVFNSLGNCDDNNFLGVLAKLVASDDTKNTAVDEPVIINVLANDVVGKPDPSTVTTAGLTQPTHGTITVNPDGTITYTPVTGYTGNDVFQYKVCSLEDPLVCSFAQVTVIVSCISIPNQNTINGIVFTDINSNGTLNTGDNGRSGVDVKLYNDINGNGVFDANETLVTSKTTDAMGTYQFDITPPTSVNTYLDMFNSNTTANQTNGTASWSGNSWVEVVESDGFAAGDITITSANGLRIQNSNNGALRTANLSGAIAATLTFSYKETGLDLDVNDYVDVEIATTASPSNWTLLHRYTGADGNQTGASSFDITPYISGTTTIRFKSSTAATMLNGDIVDFDNVQISYNTPTAAKYLVKLAQPITTGFTLTAPSPSPSGYYPVSFTGSGAGACQKSFGLAGADLSITKTDAPDPVATGSTLTYTIIVTNNGPTNADGVVMTDAVLATLTGVTYSLDGGSSYEWTSSVNLGTMPPSGPGSTHSIIITGTVSLNICTPISNTASVSGSTTDLVFANNSATVITAVNDNTPPTITTCAVTRNIVGCNTTAITGPAYSAITAASSEAELENATNLGLSSDNCGITSVTYIDAATESCPISVTRTWTIKDAAGNSANCDQLIKVGDDTNPIAICKNITVALNASGNATITAADINNSSTDNCGIASLGVSKTSFTCSDIGPNTVTLTVTDNCGNSSTCDAIVTVTDTIAPALSINDVTVNENAGNATFIVTLTKARTCDVTFTVNTANNTAVSDSDYTSITSATYTIPAGSTSVNISVPIINNVIAEPTETFFVNLSNPTYATISDASGLGTILDDDAVTLALSGFTVTEINGTQTENFVVTLNIPAQEDIVITFTTANVTATSGSDYTGQTTVSYTIPVGSTTFNIPVDILGDLISEPTETFTGTIAISNANGQNVSITTPTATSTINDNDAVSVAIDDVSVNENAGNATFTVTLTGNIQDALTVDYASADGTAMQPGDYTTSAGTVTFPAGSVSGATQTITVPIINDLVSEPIETYTVNLSNIISTGSASKSDASGLGTILDDDAVTLALSGFTVTEINGTQTENFVVILNIPAQEDIVITFTTANVTATSGSDYTGQTTVSYTIPAGSTTFNIPVDILGDLISEPTETFTGTIAISNANGQNVSITTPTATSTINDNDAVSIAINDVTVNENAGNATFTVTLTGNIQDALTVDYASADGTAMQPGDYTTSAGTVT